MSKLLIALALCLLFSGTTARASELPTAPIQQPVFSVVDYSIAGGLIASRAIDWASTTECQRRSWCKEEVLPRFVVKSKVRLGVFEAGAASVEVFSMYELKRRGHGRMARAVGIFDLSAISLTQVNNYSLRPR